MGTVRWPLVEGSRWLFAEGGKTTPGLLIQPHLGAPGSAARRCLPWLPARVTQGRWAWREQGGCWGRPGPRPERAGRPQCSPGNSKKEPGPGLWRWPRVPATEGVEAAAIPALSPQSPHPSQGHPAFLPRGWVSLAEPENPRELRRCRLLRNFKKPAFYSFLKHA